MSKFIRIISGEKTINKKDQNGTILDSQIIEEVDVMAAA